MKPIKIHKDVKHSKFTTLSNDLVRDKKLSFRARGILGMVFSNCPEWETTSQWLEDNAPDGREAIRSAMRELEQFGYLKYTLVRDEKGRISRESDWYETPLPEAERSNLTKWQPEAGSPTNGKPTVGNPPPSEAQSHKTTSQKIKKEEQLVLSNDPSPRKAHPQFIQAWCEEYQKHWGMKYVLQKSDTAPLKTFLEAVEEPIGQLIQKAKEAWKRGREDPRGSFACRRASSIRPFCQCYNDLCAELSTPIRTGGIEIPDRD